MAGFSEICEGMKDYKIEWFLLLYQTISRIEKEREIDRDRVVCVSNMEMWKHCESEMVLILLYCKIQITLQSCSLHALQPQKSYRVITSINIKFNMKRNFSRTYSKSRGKFITKH